MAAPVFIDLILTTESSLKWGAVSAVIKKLLPNGFFRFLGWQGGSALRIPAQPLNSGLVCAKMRIQAAAVNLTSNQFVVSIENGIEFDEFDRCVDVCFCVMEADTGEQVTGRSFEIPVDRKYLEEAQAECKMDYRGLGLSVTVGEMIQKEFPDIDPKNWMADDRFAGIDREFQIIDAVVKCIRISKLFID